mmetsp:Transcript_2308/g.4773  ORF Transcript_2308/g.4773 Transcript_2308/m.4773 type:complete len:212 (-) Transcript_2308:537-1172(-)
MNAAARALLSGVVPAAASASTKKHVERRIVRTRPSHLHRIISDVESYSKFLPLCTNSKVIRRSDCGTMFDATLTVGLPPLLTEEYVSRVKLDAEAMTVEARSIKSTTFDSLRSRWKLRSVQPPRREGRIHSKATDCHKAGDGSGGSAQNNSKEIPTNASDDADEWCDVEFEVEIKVSDPVIVGALDRILEEVAGKQVSAFERRCLQIPEHQ